jgi:hypothetical protein
MAKSHPLLKEVVADLSKKELEKLVLKAAIKSKAFHDYLVVNHIGDGLGEQELFEQAKEAIINASFKNFRGRSYEKQQNRFLMAALKIISEFDKNAKTKTLTLDLLIDLIRAQVDDDLITYNTYYQAYDNKMISLVERAKKMTQKIHPDLVIDYKGTINKFVYFLKGKCRNASHLEEL